MRVAVICEYSGTVRDSFARLGHEAVSFDLLPSETPGEHVQGDIQSLDREYWSQFDLAVCHPPCTHLAVSGAAWFKHKKKEQAEALEFVRYRSYQARLESRIKLFTRGSSDIWNKKQHAYG